MLPTNWQLVSVMWTNFLARLLARTAATSTFPLLYQSIPKDHRPVYVIGDLHGCARLLRRIEMVITQDLNGGDGHVVLLGDVIDRGPESAEILDHLLRRPPDGQTRHVLLGNHEVMFARFLDDPTAGADWLEHGGVETLLSYGIEAHSFASLTHNQRRLTLDAHIPAAHRAFLSRLPAVAKWDNVVFAHAGVDFAVDLTAQTEEVLLWSRAPVAPDAVPNDMLFVHGHFPIDSPSLNQNVINLDVGAYFRNSATILRISTHGEMALIEI